MKRGQCLHFFAFCVVGICYRQERAVFQGLGKTFERRRIKQGFAISVRIENPKKLEVAPIAVDNSVRMAEQL